MRCRGYRVGALGDHSRPRDVPDDLGAGKMSSDTGLCALTHLDLDRRSGAQVVLVHAETPRRHLHHRVFPVAVEILVQSALAGVVHYSELLGRRGERGMGVVADRAVAHRREHHRHRKIELGRQLPVDPPVFVPLHPVGLGAEKDSRLHRFPQRVDRGIRHL